MDRADPALATMARLKAAASAQNLDLEDLFDAGSPRTQLLWQVMGEIEGGRGGHLIVPSREHLTGIGPSGKAVIQRLTYMPQAHIYYLAPAAPRNSADQQQPCTSIQEQTPPKGLHLLAESTVGAIPTVTRWDFVEQLTVLGWPDLMAPVDQLYMALAEDANAAAKAAGEPGISPFGHQGTIRLLQHNDGRLVVELMESRLRNDPVTAKVAALCAHAERVCDRDHTSTRCTLSCEYARPSGAFFVRSGGRS
ncbi:hypothetical protein [Nocardia sp. NPDC047038]|uniref:hypothetical protein n=1 Tax=Nocardia sp. NPDC047038 TaxID=3154338 RepID=UPI003400D60E